VSQGIRWGPMGKGPLAAINGWFIRSDWQPCTVAYGFKEAARTPGEVAESECDLSILANRLPGGGEI
jgi:hypothetical protein